MTPRPGLTAYPARYDHERERQPVLRRRRAAAWTALGLLTAVAAFYGGLQAVLMHDNGCELTPPGYFNQNLVSQTPHAFHTTCVLDPNNGEPRYTIHRPWQSVHGL